MFAVSILCFAIFIRCGEFNYRGLFSRGRLKAFLHSMGNKFNYDVATFWFSFLSKSHQGVLGKFEVEIVVQKMHCSTKEQFGAQIYMLYNVYIVEKKSTARLIPSSYSCAFYRHKCSSKRISFLYCVIYRIEVYNNNIP